MSKRRSNREYQFFVAVESDVQLVLITWKRRDMDSNPLTARSQRLWNFRSRNYPEDECFCLDNISG